MTFDAYTVYCDHCLARGQTPPTRAWWDAAVMLGKCEVDARRLTDTQFDIETERREGWAYENY